MRFGNKIADKITSVGKSKTKEKKMNQMKFQPEKT